MLKLQRAQNSLARLATYTKRVEHAHPVLHQLYWLPINYRINYKVATQAYKVRSPGSKAYLLPSDRQTSIYGALTKTFNNNNNWIDPGYYRNDRLTGQE